MTLQEIYNKTKEHLLRQGIKAEARGHNNMPLCAYWLPNGLKCAIGCHIPDELYDPAMEGKGFRSLTQDYPEVLKTIFGEDAIQGDFTSKTKASFLERLQNIHDSDYIQPNMWKNNLEALAVEFDLIP